MKVILVVQGLVKGIDVTDVAKATATLTENTIRHRASQHGIDFLINLLSLMGKIAGWNNSLGVTSVEKRSSSRCL